MSALPKTDIRAVSDAVYRHPDKSRSTRFLAIRPRLFKIGTEFHAIFKIAGTVYIASSCLRNRLSRQFKLGWKMFQHIKVVSMATAMLAVLSTVASISTASASVDEDGRTSLNTNAAEHVSIYSAQARLAAAASFRSIGIGY